MKKYLLLLALISCGDHKVGCKEEKKTIGDCETNPKGVCSTTTTKSCKEFDVERIRNIVGN